MDNEYLDLILRKLNVNRSFYMDVFETEFSPEIVVTKFRPAIQYLVERNFIKSKLVGSQMYLELSPEGIRHILNGGFVGQEKYNNEILNYTKGSRDYAQKAYKVAIMGIIVTVILFIVTLILKL